MQNGGFIGSINSTAVNLIPPFDFHSIYRLMMLKKKPPRLKLRCRIRTPSFFLCRNFYLIWLVVSGRLQTEPILTSRDKRCSPGHGNC